MTLGQKKRQIFQILDEHGVSKCDMPIASLVLRIVSDFIPVGLTVLAEDVLEFSKVVKQGLRLSESHDVIIDRVKVLYFLMSTTFTSMITAFNCLVEGNLFLAIPWVLAGVSIALSISPIVGSLEHNKNLYSMKEFIQRRKVFLASVILIAVVATEVSMYFLGSSVI